MLNPGKSFGKAGETIVVANVSARKELPRIARLEVDKKQGSSKRSTGAWCLLAFYPASIGSPDRPTPSGTLKVTSTNEKPTYHYNPEYKFKSVKSREPFDIKLARTIRWDRTGSGCRRRAMASTGRRSLRQGQQVGVPRLRSG